VPHKKKRKEETSVGGSMCDKTTRDIKKGVEKKSGTGIL